MSLRKNCPCDIDNICPYEAEYNRDCEYWCSEKEPDENYEDDCDYEVGYDPYLGCFSDDC